jgi:hypothetical protein
MKGRTNLYSFCGVGCSIIHLIAIFVFACLKLSFVVIKFNPAISVFKEPFQYETEDKALDMKKLKFKIGFFALDFETQEVKNDPKYVNWRLKTYLIKDNALKYIKEAGLHKCTEQEYEEFYEPAESNKNYFEKHKKAKSFMCLNEFDNNGDKVDYKLYGGLGSGLAHDIEFFPCIPKQLTPYNEHLVEKECIADLNDKNSVDKKLKDSMDYLGKIPALSVVYNYERFDLNKFEKQSTVRESHIFNRPFDKT